MSGITCPGCEQAIVVTDGVAECGGEGDGICCWAHYALMVRDDRPAVWEWTEIDDPDPPSNKLVRAIVEAFGALRAQPCEHCGCPVAYCDKHERWEHVNGETCFLDGPACEDAGCSEHGVDAMPARWAKGEA